VPLAAGRIGQVDGLGEVGVVAGEVVFRRLEGELRFRPAARGRFGGEVFVFAVRVAFYMGPLSGNVG